MTAPAAMLNGQSLYRPQGPKGRARQSVLVRHCLQREDKTFFADANRVAISSSEKAQLKLELSRSIRPI
jgi:hypothetical protein